MPDLGTIARLAAVHHGVVTAAQLDSLGIARSTRRTLVGSGFLRSVARGVYVVSSVPVTSRQPVAIAVAATGGAASRRTAAHLHRLPGFALAQRPEVVVHHSREHHRSSVAEIHATTDLTADDLVVVDGIRCSSVARTLFSLAGMVPMLPLDRVRGAVDDAVRLGLATDPWLWWRLEALRCRGRTGVEAFEKILASRATNPTESWLEREYLRVTARCGLPTPVCQARIRAKGAFAARVDFLYPEAKVVVEVAGAVAHASAAQRAADAARRNRLLLEGFLVLEFTYEQVVRDPALVVASVREALARRPAA